MEKHSKLIALVLILFFWLYYFIPISFNSDSQIILSVSTFLFAIFTGFFISRQGTRYSSIRDEITDFDGEMSAIYRKFGHVNKAAQKQVAKIIKQHYQVIIKHKAWDYNFVNKSSTLADIHNLLEKTTKNKSLTTLKSFATQRVLVSLENAQVSRKRMVALHQERIPKFQWILIYFLGIILLISMANISSYHILMGSILKAVFSGLVIFVILMLSEFDNLEFFEGTIGEKSAQDVLDILANKK